MTRDFLLAVVVGLLATVFAGCPGDRRRGDELSSMLLDPVLGRVVVSGDGGVLHVLGADSISTFDLSDPRDPVLTDEVPSGIPCLPDGGWRDWCGLDVHGGSAYVAVNQRVARVSLDGGNIEWIHSIDDLVFFGRPVALTDGVAVRGYRIQLVVDSAGDAVVASTLDEAAHEVFGGGDSLFAVTGSSELLQFDVSDPRAPVLEARMPFQLDPDEVHGAPLYGTGYAMSGQDLFVMISMAAASGGESPCGVAWYRVDAATQTSTRMSTSDGYADRCRVVDADDQFVFLGYQVPFGSGNSRFRPGVDVYRADAGLGLVLVNRLEFPVGSEIVDIEIDTDWGVVYVETYGRLDVFDYGELTGGTPIWK